MSLPPRYPLVSHQRVRGKLVWAWRVPGSTWPQGTRIRGSVYVFNGTPASIVHKFHGMGMQLLCLLFLLVNP
eukprot:1158897-Pelagomonas_calceolata.AAC.7